MTHQRQNALWTLPLLAFLAAGPVSAAYAAEPASRAYLHSYNIPSSGLALEGYCPVAYFAVNKPVLGKAEYASDHNGVTYHFVSADAKKAFDADPEKFIPAFGGWCAFGMAVNDKFPVDPTNFKIVDGRLMVFLKNKSVDARALWNQGKKMELIKKAEAHCKIVSK
jgi:YHS domain-containing protein